MFGLDLALRLPVTFEPARLKADLRAAEQFEFKQHPLNYHDGSWTAINLIYADGEIEYRHKGAHGFGTAAPRPTEVLKICPYFQEVFRRLPGEVIMARLSSIAAGGRIHEHHDATESVDFGCWRIHIPVVTDPRVKLFIGFRQRRWKEGEAWVGDFTFPHSIHNASPAPRVHIVADMRPSDEMLAWLPKGHMSPAAIRRRARLREIHQYIEWRRYKRAGVDRSGRRDRPPQSAS